MDALDRAISYAHDVAGAIEHLDRCWWFLALTLCGSCLTSLLLPWPPSAITLVATGYGRCAAQISSRPLRGCISVVDRRRANAPARDHPVTTRMISQAYAAGLAAPACPSLIDAWMQFLAERSIALCATSLSTDYAQVTKWLKRCPVEDLRQGRQVLIWVLQQSPVQAARRVTMYVRSMYRWAAAEDVGLLPSNPVANFRMPKAPQRDHEITVIPRHEIPLVLAALEAKRHHRSVNWAVYAEFMLQTAMRTGEVRAMKWSDIKDQKVLVHSNFTLTHGHKNSTKTNKQCWVPLNARAQQLLAQVDRSNDYVFPWSRLAFQSFFSDRMKELHAAGLIEKRYRPYDLRHVAISRWLEAGIPVAAAASWAGNTSEVIWKHYANTTQDYEIPVL